MTGPAPPVSFSNTKALGRVLYTDYVFAFEIAAIILLVAIVAAIAITLRHRKETKYQDARTQLSVRASDRLKIIKFPPEPSANRAPDTGGPT
jgi:NADH-quinone oxidoreductase subunit J